MIVPLKRGESTGASSANPSFGAGGKYAPLGGRLKSLFFKRVQAGIWDLG